MNARAHLRVRRSCPFLAHWTDRARVWPAAGRLMPSPRAQSRHIDPRFPGGNTLVRQKSASDLPNPTVVAGSRLASGACSGFSSAYSSSRTTCATRTSCTTPTAWNTSATGPLFCSASSPVCSRGIHSWRTRAKACRDGSRSWRSSRTAWRGAATSWPRSARGTASSSTRYARL